MGFIVYEKDFYIAGADKRYVIGYSKLKKATSQRKTNCK